MNGDIRAIVRDIQLRDTKSVRVDVDPVSAQLRSWRDGSGGIGVGRCSDVLIGRSGTIGIAVGLSCVRGIYIGCAGDIGVGRCRGVSARLRRCM